MSLRFVLSLAVVAVAFSNVKAITDEEKKAITESVMKFVKECSEEYNISEDKLKEARDKKSSEGIEPCAIGCVFKRAQFINDQGLFDADKAKASGSKFISSDDDKKMYDAIADDCASVNDESVTDGEAGCERAKLLLACLAKHKEMLAL